MSQKAILDFLAEHRNGRVALVGHQRPDGDSIGACVGLALALREAGFRADAVLPAPPPPNIAFLVSDAVVRPEAPDWHKDYDCLGVLDCGEADRVDPLNREALTVLPAFNIDHHVSSRGVGRAVWIDPEASSTGEMTVRLCQAAGWRLGRAAATALWTAIVTDTGRFSFENTSVAALAAAMACLEAGVSPGEVTAHVYQSVTLAERRLQSLVLSRMEFHENGRMAVSWLGREDFDKAGIGVEGAQDLIGLLRETDGVEVAVFLYELGGSVKVSLRTAPPHNAVDVVGRFGGGGHVRAAGCSLGMPMAEARDVILGAVRNAFFS